MRKQHVRRLSPKQSAVNDFMEHCAAYLPRTCWADPCTSWFKQGTKDGQVVMWPGSRLAFFDLMQRVNWEDYEVEYWSGNRWGWLGNGFSSVEFDGETDITYYLDGEKPDSTDLASELDTLKGKLAKTHIGAGISNGA